ncbi:MAG: ROK family protein, partial [Bacteroidales bacterium]
MQAMKSNVIGIDIGGTKIRAGVVGCDGSLKSSSISIPTDAGMPKERIIDSVLRLIHSVADGRDVCGIGIGCTGPLDKEKGMILDANTLPSLNYFNIKECLEEEFELPA